MALPVGRFYPLTNIPADADRDVWGADIMSRGSYHTDLKWKEPLEVIKCTGR